MSYLVIDGTTPIASLEMGIVPSDAVSLSPQGDEVVAWTTAGCPSLKSFETDKGISETPILVPPSDALWGLAFLDAVEERGWEVFDERELGGPGSGRYPKGSGESKAVGVMEGTKSGDWQVKWYSFPEGGAWEADHLDSFPVNDINVDWKDEGTKAHSQKLENVVHSRGIKTPEGSELIYRLGSKESKTLNNRNGANADGLVNFIERTNENLSHTGDTIHVHAVKFHAPLGEYELLRRRALGGPGSGRYPKGSGEHPRGGAFPTGLTKIGNAKGSNPGGVYQDASGQKWYVKNYRNADQAAGEHAANAVYSAVGVDVADSRISEDGKTIALRWQDGEILNKHGLDKETANNVLDGFAADVFTRNWDAVGTGHDNVLVKSSGAMRIDQGGALLHRAQGAPKPEAGRHDIGEWESLVKENPYYAEVFRRAGVKSGDALGERAAKQIDAIIAGRPAKGWESLIRETVPKASEDYKRKVGAMLEARQQKLEAKRDQLRARGLSNQRSLGGPGSGRYPKGSGEHSRAMATLSGLQKKFGEIIPQGEIFKGYDLNHEAVNVYNDGIDTSYSGTIESIDPRKILATQDEVDVTGLTHYLNGTGQEKSEPVILRLGGENFVVEGHHRVGAALLRGDATVQAEVYDAGKLLGLGGAGSGNHGHAGRPGQVGGSSIAHFVKATAAQRKELKLPPGWTDVRVNPDPNGDTIAVGTDKKGRVQRRYSVQHSEVAAAEKFERMKAFHETVVKLREQVENDLLSDDPKVREAATAIRLIDRTSFRIGSNRDTLADKKAYGATTLQGRHVKVNGDEISFKFVGKKGVNIAKKVEDAKLARALEPRINGKEPLFSRGTDTRVRAYLEQHAPGFTPKDFRTYRATSKALAVLKTITVPDNATKAERVKLRKEIAKVVASQLGNTAAVSLKSYIDPAVFGKLDAS